MSPSSSPTYVDIPVLISGAGPTGLYAAVLLTQLNIPCRLIERHLDVSPLSKALVIHSRTMEIFALSGIIDKFLERSEAVSDFHAYIGSKHVAVLPALANKESHYTFGLFLEQKRTVDILAEDLEAMGGKVDRGWELVDTKVVEEEASGKSWVETTIRRAIVGTNIRETESHVLGVVEEDPEEQDKKYETQVVKSEYMIATDGGKSAVRHKLNIGFPGRTLDNNIIIFDGHVESDIQFNNITAINGVNDRVMAVFPLHDGQVRIIVDNGHLTPEEHEALKSEDLTVEQFEQLAAACIAPAKFKCIDCSWLTYYRVNERQAENYAYKNRIFLAGDACHVHSPAGGQGMNLGLQDSFNLTWKLALVLHGIAPKTILETYEAERKPVADGIIKLTAKFLERGMAQDFIGRTLRKIAFTIAPYILPYIAPDDNPITMLAIRYHENAINQRSKSQASIDEVYQVGQRARDGELHVVQKQGSEQASVDFSVRLHELLVGPGIFHVLVFASDMLLSSTKTQTIKGVETTNSDTLAKEIETHLTAWRSKWAYKKEGSTTLSLPPLKNASLDAIPHPPKPDILFMVHVLASDLAVPPAQSSEDGPSSVESSTDVLAENKAGEGKIYLDHLGLVHQKYGVLAKHGPGAIVVVRPDSHMGYRVLGAGKTAWDEIDVYFESILVK
ncbi:FAD binding domain-containing protein [Dissophora ornata]|nr:hypothetical protein BGZ58_010516 [Dissophora ornata]KAI8602845.1 FAD binding domain-containing protein [Dissophora ornata]